MWMEVMRVGRRRGRWAMLRMDICSTVSRKVTQLSFHSSWPVQPVAEGPSAWPGRVSHAHGTLPSTHPHTSTALRPQDSGGDGATWHLDPGQQVRPRVA